MYKAKMNRFLTFNYTRLLRSILSDVNTDSINPLSMTLLGLFPQTAPKLHPAFRCPPVTKSDPHRPHSVPTRASQPSMIRIFATLTGLAFTPYVKYVLFLLIIWVLFLLSTI
jgi:hypothetical protein